MKSSRVEIDTWHPDVELCSMCEEVKPVARYVVSFGSITGDFSMCVGCLHESAACVTEAAPDPIAANVRNKS